MDLGRLKEGGIAAWVRWAVREKGLVAVLILVLIALGGFGLVRMNKDEFPTFQLKQGLVAGVYPGASATEVEERLTKPLEDYLFTFKEVSRERTFSVTKSGICYIYVDLRDEVSQSLKDEVWSKIKLGLQQQQLTLPAGVLTVAVLDDFGNTSSLLLSMESSERSYLELQEYAEELCIRLQGIPELAKATVIGKQEEEIAVTLDRERLSAYGIDPAAIFLDYQAASLPLPSGTYVHNGKSERVSIAAAVESEREVAERIIWSDPQGRVVRLKDIASIERRYKTPTQYVSNNGNACLIVNVEMLPDHNIVAFGKSVENVLQEYRSTLPDGVDITRVSDQPHVVGTSVWSFLRDLLISMLVVIVVMLMLFPMRSALIASSGVPVCIAVAIAVMYITGMPLNTVTLAALIVTLGMIVDDSIITMDGYMTQTSNGFHGVDAAAASAKELFMPTFMATLAICLMFFPMTVIITGYLGDFVKLFPWIILISLMTSLFYAVTAVPSLEVRYIKAEEASRRKNIIARAQDWFFGILQKIYENCLGWCFRHPGLTIAMGVAAVALGLFMFSRINIQMMPKAARDFFVTELTTEAGTAVEVTSARADSLVSLMLSDERIVSATAFVGTGAPRFVATYAPILPSPQTAQIIVRTVSNKATVENLREYIDRYEHLFPDTQIHFKQMDYQVVEAPVCVSLYGDDRKALIEPAQKISAYLASLNTQTHWVHSDADDFAPEVELVLDRDEASRLGVSKAVLSLNMASALGGQNIATLWEGARAVPVNLYSDNTPDYASFGDMMIATAVPGVKVPLRQVASVQPAWEPATLSRMGGRPSVSVSCDLKQGASQPAVQKQLKAYIDREILPTLPEGVTVEYRGLSSMNKMVGPQIAWAFIAACAVLFIFLLIHFGKARIAALTMILSLLCLFGAFFGLWLFGLDFGMTAVLGLISLVGIIVRNGILMFEYAEEARAHESVRDAAMHAGQRRMRPIFLTSCTTALGVLPMILSGDLLWMPMGVVICFGTMLTIFLITLIMPVSYWQLFKKEDRI